MKYPVPFAGRAQWEKVSEIQPVLGSVVLPVDDLILPLRVDVLARADVLAFYLEHKSAWQSERADFLQQARAQLALSYASDTCWRRWQMWIHGQQTVPQKVLDAVFAGDVEKTIAVYESIQKDGWHKTSRITVIRAQVALPSMMGRSVTKNLFLGDGQHRMAALLMMKYTALLPQMYEFLDYDEYSPFDYTSEDLLLDEYSPFSYALEDLPLCGLVRE